MKLATPFRLLELAYEAAWRERRRSAFGRIDHDELIVCYLQVCEASTAQPGAARRLSVKGLLRRCRKEVARSATEARPYAIHPSRSTTGRQLPRRPRLDELDRMADS